jgi:tripartite-type tricarboxylate transporter receptor subunit TctC
VLARLNMALNHVLGQADFKEVLLRDGAVARPSTPEAFGELVRTDIGRWAKVIRDSGIMLD